MSAEEYYQYTTQQHITGELKGVNMYNWYSLIHFADEYHKYEMRQKKTELLSAGSYEQEAIKKECNAPEGYICNVNNEGICELATSCDYQNNKS